MWFFFLLKLKLLNFFDCQLWTYHIWPVNLNEESVLTVQVVCSCGGSSLHRALLFVGLRDKGGSEEFHPNLLLFCLVPFRFLFLFLFLFSLQTSTTSTPASFAHHP